MEKTCKHCKKIFVDVVSGRWFSNHVRWCDKNPDRNNNKIRKKNEQAINIRFGEYKPFVVCCFRCNKDFKVEEREKLFPQKEKYFCSQICSKTRNMSDESKNKIRESIFKFNDSKGIPRALKTIVCQNCNKEFETRKKVQTYCSIKCRSESRKSLTGYLQYKADCRFKFNVWDYPKEFDLSLIYKYGWYKAKNRGDNLTGISRDHKISIMFGWENGIDPNLISHPANCKLMRHNENISKHKKCSVLLEQLSKDIDNWNKKYDNIENKGNIL